MRMNSSINPSKKSTQKRNLESCTIPKKNKMQKKDSQGKLKQKQHQAQDYSNPMQQVQQQPNQSNRTNKPQSQAPPLETYRMDVVPLSIFECQIIPVNIHNLSKSFRPNLATVRVLSVGTKFIPTWDHFNWKKTFVNFNDFRRKMNNRAFFVQKTPGFFC